MKNTSANTTRPMPSPDPEILGRIILIQSTLHLMGQGSKMARFLCRGFSRVPGMEKSGIFIDGRLHWENGSSGPEQQHCRRLFEQLIGATGQATGRKALLTGFKRSQGVECLPIETALAVYGIFFCAPADEEMFFSYAPFIENTLNLAALVLENHSQQQMLRQHKSDLEKKVKERTQELACSEQRFRDLFNSISDLVYTQDLEGRLISANPALHRLFGYRAEELLGRTISDFMLPEHRDRFESEYLGAIFEKGSYEGITPYLAKDGSTIYIEYRSELVRPENDAPFISGIGRDVTGRVLARREKRRLEGQIRQTQKMESIGTLSGGVAHDFNNVLSIIIGNAELAAGELAEDHRARSYVNEIQTAGVRAKDVVRQLLTFSRKTREEKQAVDLCMLVGEALKLLRPVIAANIEIRTRLPEQPAVVSADPTQIHQVLINLCGNAADAMAMSGGILTVSLAAAQLKDKNAALDPDMGTGRFFRLAVKDTGHGIAAKSLERIFDPYFTTKDVDKGTGLGLSVVHGIVKSHGGSIRVRSQPGQGCEFEILLPAAEKNAEAVLVQTGDTPRGHGRILLIDDEPMIVSLNQQRLEKLGYRVSGHTNPKAALEMFSSDPYRFELVITDMTMPHITGDRLAEKILEIRPEMRIILCTGYSIQVSDKTAASLGIARYLEKPVQMQQLAEAVCDVLSVSGD
ncbi:MAG: PAS domain S-box protein [Desulfosalsimonas sp.]|uniref:hybrid sensor histidine kinase/response regulator n=1 Tax=Desulfosalsimonas sp. TaxID=3073848 RepID=UPI0039706560